MSAEPASPKRSKLKIAAFGVGLVLLLLFIVSAVLRQQGGSQLAKAIQEARELGGPVTLEEVLAARQVPLDERNGAMIVLSLKPTLDAMKPYPKEAPIVGNADPAPLGHRWSEQTTQAAQCALQSAAGPLAELDRLANMEGSAFPMTMPTNLLDLVGNQLSYLATVRACVKLQSLQAMTRVMNGDRTHLVADVENMQRLVEMVDRTPMLIPIMVGSACEALTIDIVQEACGIETFDAQELAQIAKTFEQSEHSHAMPDAIRGERAYSMAMFDYFRNSGSGLTALNALQALPGILNPKNLLYGLMGGIEQDEAASLHLFNKLLAGLEAGRPLQTIVEVGAEIDSVSRFAILTRTGFTVHCRAIELDLRTVTQVRAARAALAAERYRLATGSFPVRPEDLAPAYIERIPEDPFKPGEPIRMVVKGDRVVFYGIGEDRTDNGGDVEYVRELQKLPTDWGFTLLVPAARNQPAVPKKTQTNAESQPTTVAE